MERPAMLCSVLGNADFMRVPKPAARITAVRDILIPCCSGVFVAVEATPCQSLPLSCGFNSRVGVQHSDPPHPAARPRRYTSAFRAGHRGGAEPADAGAWTGGVLRRRDRSDGGRWRGEADRAGLR